MLIKSNNDWRTNTTIQLRGEKDQEKDREKVKGEEKDQEKDREEKNNRPKEEWAGNRRKNFIKYIATFIVDKNNLKLSAVLLYVPIDMKMDICPQRGHKKPDKLDDIKNFQFKKGNRDQKG